MSLTPEERAEARRLVQQVRTLHKQYRASLRFAAVDSEPPDPSFGALPAAARNLSSSEFASLRQPELVKYAVVTERALTSPQLTSQRAEWAAEKDRRRQLAREKEAKQTTVTDLHQDIASLRTHTVLAHRPSAVHEAGGGPRSQLRSRGGTMHSQPRRMGAVSPATKLQRHSTAAWHHQL